MPFSADFDQRLARNNFDLLRLLFAATVGLVHLYELSGFKQLAWISKYLSSAIAVQGFFVVSGFLIFMSHERSASLASYAGKRLRRIYPAYFTIVMLCAFGLALVSSKTAGEYFSLAWLKYVIANLGFLNFLQLSLPGVFETHRWTAVNGALWTLKIEVMFYLSVPVFALLFRRFRHLPVIALAYLASIGYAEACHFLAERTGSGLYRELGNQLPGQLSYFMAGAFFYYFRHGFGRSAAYWAGAAALVLTIDRSLVSVPLLEPLALATLVAFFGLFLYLGNFGRYGDFSYGVYIIHFPVIQLLLDAGWRPDRPLSLFCAAAGITAVGAVAMWHLVEKRFLLRGNHYVAAASR